MNYRTITRAVPIFHRCIRTNNNYLTRVTSPLKSQLRFESDSSQDAGAPRPVPFHRTSKFDKYCLVWTKRYKSVAEVPDQVSIATILKTRDWMRIRVSLMMVFGGALLCYGGVKWGKYDKDRGRTITVISDEFKKKQIEKYYPSEK